MVYAYVTPSIQSTTAGTLSQSGLPKGRVSAVVDGVDDTRGQCHLRWQR